MIVVTLKTEIESKSNTQEHSEMEMCLILLDKETNHSSLWLIEDMSLKDGTKLSPTCH